ncbi:unnamed protein product [Sphagnum jensenii]|uniref:Ubiquitin-like protease family profile domain-containing protein n=1 Tax=Sphagnum jensenii TaxID=128206 RepID=A0ABP1ADJ7_9BRYO
MFEDMETANKRQKPLVEIETETSVFDFIEEEEDRPASSSRLTTETFYKRRNGTPLPSAIPRPDWLRRPALKRPVNAIQEISRNDASRDEVIVTASRARFGLQHVKAPSMRFTSHFVEFRAVKGFGQKYSITWRLEEIRSFMCYYVFHSPLAEEKAMVWIDVHKESLPCKPASLKQFALGSGRFQQNTDTYVLEVNNKDWIEHQRTILAMTKKYKEIWGRCTSDEAEIIREQLARSPLRDLSNNVHQTRANYVPRFKAEESSISGRISEDVQKFEVLVYPRNDSDAVTVTRSDFEMLKPMGFLSDSVIDFYIKYLQAGVPTKNQAQFYFFNSFFYRKLAEPGKNSQDSGKSPYERVKKWTRKVNLFDKDYIFIPVNQRSHWSLIIICHLGHLARSPEHSGSRLATPCILHLDSLEGSHGDVEKHIQRYLSEAWMERNQTLHLSGNLSHEVLPHIQFYRAEVPQQTNLCDCGLFLLHYVEVFLRASQVYQPQRQGIPDFLTRDWFKTADVSAKRQHIQELLLQLHQAMRKNNLNNGTKVLPADETLLVGSK